MFSSNTISCELTSKQFQKVAHIVYDYCGINLKSGKEALVRARLMKRLRALKLGDVSQYIGLIESESGREELAEMIDVMTTNKTSFFREIDHFHYLRDTILPSLNQNRLRFWSAACSSGEEPYSIAILLREHLPNVDRRDVKVLATDISYEMIDRAKQAIYPKELLTDVPTPLRKKYFKKAGAPGSSGAFVQVDPKIQTMTHIAWLNLMEKWPMKGPFDVIFCRNVMIYFDRSTQERLINRYYDLLRPGGHLFVGHSEGLSAVKHQFKYVKPAVYLK